VEVIVLSAAEVERLLPMGDCIDLMSEALAAMARGDALVPLRSMMPTPDGRGLLGLMPGYLAGSQPAFGFKAVSVFPGNAALGLETHQGAVALLDPDTGRLTALMDGSTVTAIRTAAVSALSVRHLARTNASELAILGAGTQARRSIEAVSCVRSLSAVRIWNRTRERADALQAELAGRYDIPIAVTDTAAAAVHGADIVVTTMHSTEPVLEATWLAPGAHVAAVGGRPPEGRELDTATIAAARLYVDRRESALNEGGDVRIPIREGAIQPEHIVAELGEVVAGRASGRGSDDELTVFKSFGISVEDMAAAAYVVRQAIASGAGTRVEF
jgi:ornithine cyclodeaminase/alanine dehydrogenase-like protein (mu-crystallin family)